MTNKDFSKTLFSGELELMGNIASNILQLKKMAYFVFLSPANPTLEERYEIWDYGYIAAEHICLIFLVGRNKPVVLEEPEMQYLLLTGEVKSRGIPYCFRGKNKKFSDEISLLFKARRALMGKYLFASDRELNFFLGTIRNILMDDGYYYFDTGDIFMMRPIDEGTLQELVDKKSHVVFGYRYAISDKLGNLDDVIKHENPEEEKLVAKIIKERLKNLEKSIN